MEFTKEHAGMLQETHDNVTKIRAVLLDTNGNEGLASTVSKVCADHYKLKRTVYVLIAFLIGSGVITGTVLGVFNGG